ncbi:hypothetical protein [Streptomyces sp. B6B3]|uniref:hypothetical protein n=1 Tax=Streptomyces sp. B6B3 TaxID=3153570 RepID=UPI00325C7798
MTGHAEIAQVWPRDGRLRLVGHLHGAEAEPAGQADWSLLLVLRDDHALRLSYPAELEGPGFDVSLPVEDLVPEQASVPAQWDLYMTRASDAKAPRLRVGRLLDDIEGKKKIMVFPAQPVTTQKQTVMVRPYYTLHDNLSVECLPQKA